MREVELVAPPCRSARQCRDTRHVILNERLEVVGEVHATRRYRGEVLRYRVPESYYVVKLYESCRGNVYVTPVHPASMPPDVFEQVKRAVLRYYGFERLEEVVAE